MSEVEYVALKRMKVQELDEAGEPVLVDGRPVLREVAPGELLPEAAGWGNLYKEVRAGRVGMKGTPVAGPALADAHRRRIHLEKPAPKRKATRKATRRSEGSMSADEAAVARATGEAPKTVERAEE